MLSILTNKQVTIRMPSLIINFEIKEACNKTSNLCSNKNKIKWFIFILQKNTFGILCLTLEFAQKYKVKLKNYRKVKENSLQLYHGLQHGLTKLIESCNTWKIECTQINFIELCYSHKIWCSKNCTHKLCWNGDNQFPMELNIGFF